MDGSGFEPETPRLVVENVTARSDADTVDTLITPPARENSEVDLLANKPAELGTSGEPDVDSNYIEFLSDYQHKYRLKANGDLALGDDSDDSEREDVLQALERVSLKSGGVSDTEPNIDLHGIVDTGEYSDLDLDFFVTQFGDTLNDHDRVDTEPETPKDDIDLNTKTMTELGLSWNSSWRCNDIATVATTPYTNQYLRSSMSTRLDVTPDGKSETGDKGQRNKENKAGVTWDSTVNEIPNYEKDPDDKCYTILDDNKSLESELLFSRNASRLALESREAMFRRAMSLLSARCTSVRNEMNGDRLPFGYQMPKYFYVTQDKPVPMEPLKAWRGYNGNIYFEPIAINPANNKNTSRAMTSVPRTTRPPPPPPRIPTTKPRTSFDKENTSRSDSRQTNKSSQGSLLMTNRQMAILDKQTVLSRYNDSITEDLTWLEGQENTGSLAIRPKTYPEKTRKEKERDLLYNKERIKKGSVAHKVYIENKSKQKPRLTVSGGKFTPPTSMSPLLRTQTQYSLSNQRLTTNSPDPYHLNESKLPPLDQIRATIKHMDNKSETTFPSGKPYNRSVTLTDEMKPYVKYSPDVVAKMSQQASVLT